jgi:hypothetical protein
MDIDEMKATLSIWKSRSKALEKTGLYSARAANLDAKEEMIRAGYPICEALSQQASRARAAKSLKNSNKSFIEKPPISKNWDGSKKPQPELFNSQPKGLGFDAVNGRVRKCIAETGFVPRDTAVFLLCCCQSPRTPKTVREQMRSEGYEFEMIQGGYSVKAPIPPEPEKTVTLTERKLAEIISNAVKAATEGESK